MRASPDVADERRLARSVGTEEAEDAAARNAERQLIDGDHIAVPLCQLARLDDVFGLRDHSRRERRYRAHGEAAARAPVRGRVALRGASRAKA